MKYIIAFLFLYITFNIEAQVVSDKYDSHTKWQIRLTNVNTSDSTAILEIKLKVQDYWHVYTPDQDPEVGPQRMEITFHNNETFRLIEDPLSVNYIQYNDVMWPGLVTCFKGDKGIVRQKIKYLTRNIMLGGSIYYSVCSDVEGRCEFYNKTFTLYDLDSYNIYTNE